MALALVNNYTVLARENLEEVSKMTGGDLDVVELSHQLRQSELFGFTQVYWTTAGDGYWYSIRFDAESVHTFGLERLMYEAQLRAGTW